MTEIKSDVLKELIQGQSSPCVSIYMSTQAVHQGEFKKLEIRFKNLLQEIEAELESKWGFKERKISKFLEKAFSLTKDIDFWQKQKEGLAVFISANKFKYLRLSSDTFDQIDVSSNFNLKQLISDLQKQNRYYLLALSPNYNQLYELSKTDIQAIELQNSPASMEAFLNIDNGAAEKQQSINTAGGKTVFHGQGGASDDDNQDLIRYLKEIDKVINLKLKNSDQYLIVAASDNVFSLYKEINNYAKLLEKNLSGNAKQMSKKELREKSWHLVESKFNHYLQELKTKYLELKPKNKTANDLEKIVKSAPYSKIETLMLNKRAEKKGVFIQAKNEIKVLNNKKDYDLYNFAVLETLKNGGQVYSLKKEKMPENEDIIAIYRYQ
ncbi:MAG: hypothetical protein ACQER0_07100 [Bacillota bacterium]